MKLPMQIVGSIQTKSEVLQSMLCRDADKPDEALIHWWGSLENRGAIQVKLVETAKHSYALEPQIYFSCNPTGGLIVPPLSPEKIEEIKGYSATLNVTRSLISGTWGNNKGEGGQIQFNWPKSKRKLKTKKLKSWSEFKKWASDTHSENKFTSFRGHGCNKFTLETTLHRTGRTRLDRFANETIPEFRDNSEAILNLKFDPNDAQDYSTVLGLAQHHGLPTPLLDWTASPYIAAFFAFSDALENKEIRQNSTHVRIFGLHERISLNSPRIVSIAHVQPYACYLRIAPRSNARLYAQQGRFLVTNQLDVEAYIEVLELNWNEKLLVAVDVPISCAIEALKDLHFMGLTAATMFPGLDGVCKMMKYQMYF